MATFPGSIFTWTPRSDGIDWPQAADVNNPAAEIIAIETTLGINPQGVAADVKTRLVNIESSISGGPEGFMLNGKISPSVASNNLTLALKTKAGNDPSSNDKVNIVIDNTPRTCIATLSVTKNANTNWANLGSAELATLEQDLFAYLVWNTALVTPAVDIFWSRYPGGRLFSDFSAITTNEKYAAVNATPPNSTDVCVVIGRFAATLSAGAGYTWTIPAYTPLNLIQRPIYETRWCTWIPQHSRSGTTYTSFPTVNLAVYRISSEKLEFHEIHTQAATPGGSGFGNFTLPFTPLQNLTVVPGSNASDALVELAFAANTRILTYYTSLIASKQYVFTGWYQT